MVLTLCELRRNVVYSILVYNLLNHSNKFPKLTIKSKIKFVSYSVLGILYI